MKLQFLFYIFILITTFSGCGKSKGFNFKVKNKEEWRNFYKSEILNKKKDLDRIGIQLTESDVTSLSQDEQKDLALIHYTMCERIRDEVYQYLLEQHKNLVKLEESRDLSFEPSKKAKSVFRCEQNKLSQIESHENSEFHRLITSLIIGSNYQFQHRGDEVELVKNFYPTDFDHDDDIFELEYFLKHYKSRIREDERTLEMKQMFKMIEDKYKILAP